MLRHGRHTTLGEVGAAGQARIEAARAEVRLDGLAAQVAVRYLAGAGVGCLRVRDESLARLALAVDPNIRVEIDPTLEADPQDDPLGGRDSVARDLARGAHHALGALRSALGMVP